MQWHEVLRICHVEGGVRVVNPPGPKAEFVLEGWERIAFELPFYDQLGNTIKQFGVRPVGIEVFQTEEQALDGMGEWVPYLTGFPKNMNFAEICRLWQEVEHGGRSASDYDQEDISRKVSLSMRALAYRLRTLSEAYCLTLESRLRRCDFRGGVSFQTIRSTSMIYEFHSFLAEATSLRDYLATILAILIYRIPKIDSMPKLLIFLEKEGCPDALSNDLLAANAPGDNGWLFQLTAFRNLLLHNAPLQLADGETVWIQQNLTSVPGKAPLPMIQMEIRSNPESILKIRRELRGEKLRLALEDYRLSSAGISKTECLLYARAVVEKLTLVAFRIMNEYDLPKAELTYIVKSGIGEPHYRPLN